MKKFDGTARRKIVSSAECERKKSFGDNKEKKADRLRDECIR